MSAGFTAPVGAELELKLAPIWRDDRYQYQGFISDWPRNCIVCTKELRHHRQGCGCDSGMACASADRHIALTGFQKSAPVQPSLRRAVTRRAGENTELVEWPPTWMISDWPKRAPTT